MVTDLRARLGQAELPNPILTASGCAGSGRELAQFFDVSKIGAVVTKSVMLAPRAGRPPTRPVLPRSPLPPRQTVLDGLPTLTATALPP